MNKNNDLETLIPDYLEGQLSKEVVQKIEDEIQRNGDFKKEVELYQAVNEAILDKTTPQFISLLQKVEQQLEVEKESTQNSMNIFYIMRWVGMAVGILLLLWAFYYYFLAVPSPQNLYPQSTRQHQDVVLALVNKGSEDVLQINAVALEKAYAERNYEKTLALATTYLQKQPNFSVLLVKGIALLELNRFEEAVITFDALYESEANIREKGLWYKAMTYLKSNDVANTKLYLKQIVNRQSYGAEEAQRILEQLK